MRAYSLHRCLALVLFSGCLSYGQVNAQSLTVHDMPSLDLPCVPAEGIYFGCGGGIFALCSNEDGKLLSVHNGDTWQACHQLSSFDQIIPTINGELLLINQGQIFSYTWRFRGSAQRITLGAVPDGEFIINGVFLPTPQRNTSELNQFADVVLETGSGIMRCSAGKCSLISQGKAALLGIDEGRILAANPDGSITYLDRPFHPLAQLPPSCRNPKPVGKTSTGLLVFRQGSSIYSLDLTKPIAERVEQVAELSVDTELAIISDWLISFEQGEAIRYGNIANQLTWNEVERAEKEGIVTPYLPRAPLLHYNHGGRVVVQTEGGMASVESVPNTQIHVAIDPSLSSTLGRVGTDLAIGQPNVISRFIYELSHHNEAKERYPTFDNLMRNSVPTEVSGLGEQLLVGTSDARVLALSPKRKPVELVNLRTLGTAILDLYEDHGRLWGTYLPSARTSGGLFELRKDGQLVLHGDSTGLGAAVACVRSSPKGRLYTTTTSGARPLHIFVESQNLWVSLPGSIEVDEHLAELNIYELAPISDTLIYLATSRGLMSWSTTLHYRSVALPQDILDAEIRSVVAVDGGVWFSVQGKGVFYFRDNALRAVEGRSHWGAAEFDIRGLVELPDHGVCLINESKLVRLETPGHDQTPLSPGICFGNQAGRFSTFGNLNTPLIHWETDSLYINYALPGFATPDLVAAFALDGVTIRPARMAPGLAVFAPLNPGDYELSIRVLARDRSYSAAVFTQPVRVLRAWWTTAFGMVLVVFFVIVCAMGIGYLNSLRQRELAQELEQLIADRTADLELAQRRAQKASAAKSMFLANMSHEIRTPLNAVLGMSDLLIESPLNSEQHDYVDSIKRGGSALHGIVGDILDFAEIDNGQVRRREGILELRALLHELVLTYSERAYDKNLFLAYDFNVPDVVRTDGQKLRSIIGHLLGNAIKFTEHGHVDLVVEYSPDVTAAGGQLIITVSDSGIGIDEKHFASIFDVFEQADNSNTRRFGGTGLGLAIVKTYVECLDGRVAVSSLSGSGSTFRVSIPVLASSRVREFGLDPEAPAAPISVLLTSTKPLATMQIKRLLAKDQFQIKVCDALLQTQLSEPVNPDVLLHVYVDENTLSAFRQNPLTRAQLAAGKVVNIICTRRDANGIDVEQGEELLLFPIEPALAEKLASTWRSQTASRTLAAPQTVHSAQQFPANSPPAAPRREVASNGSTPKAPIFFDLGAEHPLKILVAEDNPMNKTLILTVLTKLGYKADWAENGRIALNRFGAEAYDLILMDVHMPDMDGLQATREIRRQYFERPVTICALTANASEEGREDCLSAGMDEFMTKPLNVPKLIEVLRRVEPLASRIINSTQSVGGRFESAAESGHSATKISSTAQE